MQDFPAYQLLILSLLHYLCLQSLLRETSTTRCALPLAILPISRLLSFLLENTLWHEKSNYWIHFYQQPH